MLISFKLTIQNEEIRILGCYAPLLGTIQNFSTNARKFWTNPLRHIGFYWETLTIPLTQFWTEKITKQTTTKNQDLL